MCSKHLSSPLFLSTNLELHCFECGSAKAEGVGKVGKVLSTYPLQIDFVEHFTSELPIRQKKILKKSWTDWRQENLSFLLSENINKKSLGLDLGAGTSPFSPFLDLPNLISIDFTRYPGINIVCNLSENIPIVSESIDYIIMTNLLEHLYDARIISEASRVLKKNGNLYITVPFLLGIHQEPYDYHRYTFYFLEKKLKEEGFEIEHVKLLSDFSTFKKLVETYFRFYIQKGNLAAKLLWRIQKFINYCLIKFALINFRKEFTGGYMISAKKS